MEKKQNVLFAAFEAIPFMKTGGLGDVAGSLPQALREAGCDARVMIPKFGTIPQKFLDQMTHVADFRVQLGWRDLYCGIETLTHRGVPYYFIDNEYYFKRDKAYGYGDDGERIAFFSKAIVESLRYLPEFSCDVLHCNDWHTALSPVFLRELFHEPPYDRVKTVFTVHNLKFQGYFNDFMLSDVLGLDTIPAARDQLRNGWDSVNFMKGALLYSDVLTTVSPTYAQEIKSPFYGEGMEGIFRHREGALHGILNGIDVEVFDPAADGALPANYSVDDMAGKALCKAELQRELGLEIDPNVPLVAMVGRLTDQKGLDLLQHVLDELMGRNIQMVVLGTGDKQYETMLGYFAWKHPGRLHASIQYDEALSHRIYAGADLLLMPSLFEPCGLAQMIAMRYGTLPVVRETGGLGDSVIPYNRYTGEGTGFSFRNYNAHEMMFTLLDAAELYRSDREAWNQLVRSAMTSDFSWKRAAEQYLEIYQSLHPEET